MKENCLSLFALKRNPLIFSLSERMRIEGFSLRQAQTKISFFSGFTLVELLIVFSIIGILTTGSFAAFNTYSTSQTLSNASSDLLTMIQRAKSSAQSQVKPSSGWCGTKPLYAYVVTISFIPRTYELAAICKDPTDSFAAGYGAKIPISTKTLPSGISYQFAPLTTTTNPTFEVITGNVVAPGKISITDGTSTRSITISVKGTIQ